MPQKQQVGRVFKINLFNGYHTYGYEIDNSNIVLLDIMTVDDISTDKILNLPPLFIVWIFNKAVTNWEQVDQVQLTPKQRKPPLKFIQDSIDLSLRITDEYGQGYPASFEEVQGLERMAIWHDINVEQRVRDHFAKKTNIVFQILRPKPLNSPHFSARTAYISNIGTIKKIPLAEGIHTFARELENTFFAVYDSRTKAMLPLEQIIHLPVLFTVSVSLSARIGWKSIGFIPANQSEYSLPKRYLRIGSKPTDFLIYDNPYDPNFTGRKGNIEDTEGLEPAIMWDNYQVENRIRDYYQDKPWDLRAI